jgi:hypothetical protein
VICIELYSHIITHIKYILIAISVKTLPGSGLLPAHLEAFIDQQSIIRLEQNKSQRAETLGDQRCLKEL